MTESSPAPDYSEWYTKQAAAERIGVSTKTVESLAKKGLLTAAEWKRAIGPAIVVYDPATVDRMARERGRDETLPMDGPVLDVSPSNALQVVPSPTPPAEPEESSPDEDAASVTLPPSELRFKVFLTTAEAVVYSGLGPGTLERLAREGRIIRRRDGYRGAAVYRRADLDQL